MLKACYLLVWFFYIKNTDQLSMKIDPATLPTFLTSSAVFKAKEQDRIVLPCEVTNPGLYVLAWKKGIAVLSAGSVKVSPDPRIQLIGFNLEIRNVEREDAGDYTCQIGTMEPREITHTLEVLVPPEITYMSYEDRVEVKKDSTVTLKCEAKGNPSPKITWSRKNNLLLNGNQAIVISSDLKLNNINKGDAGTYICLASNGIGEDASKEILLQVLYPPEISVENPIVHTAEGLEAQLVCNVHGENQPTVIWYKDTMQLHDTEKRAIEAHGSKHLLIIRKVYQTDLGNYTCVADNQLGKTRKSIQLTGKPKMITFKSPMVGQSRDSYNISWDVESLSPIEEYKLLYRKHSDGVFITTKINDHLQFSYNNHHPQQENVGKFEFNEAQTYSGFNDQSFGFPKTTTTKGMFDWQSVILTPSPKDSYRGIYKMNYFIRGLEPRQKYEAKVHARNKYGWTESKSLIFHTLDKDLFYSDIKHYYGNNNEPTHLQELFGIGSASSKFQNFYSTFFLLIIFFLLYYYKIH